MREWLLGLPGKDLDLTVAGRAIPLARRIGNATGGAFYVLDEATDTARVVYREPVGLVVDFAALRGPDIETDLRARDFTVNAMAVDVRTAESVQPPILDPTGGQTDLAARLLRATSEQAFQHDPVRLLRAVRFAAVLDLGIEQHTEGWLRRDAALIARPAAERVRQELALILAAPRAAEHVRRMDELGLLRHVLPEVTALHGVTQSAPHVNDVYEHTLATVAEVERLTEFSNPHLSPVEAEFLGPLAAELAAHLQVTLSEDRTRRTLLKLAALLHDAGKPAMRNVEPSGRVRFFGHEQPGAELTAEALTRLRFSAQEIHWVGTTVAQHMRPGFLVKEPPVTRRALYRFFRDSGAAGVDVLLLALADHLAARGPNLLPEHYRQQLQLTHWMLENYFHKPQEVIAPPPLVNGRDVMKLLGLPPGTRVGELLEAVREAQAEGEVRTRDEAVGFLKQAGAADQRT